MNQHQLFFWRNDAISNKEHHGWYCTRTLSTQYFDSAQNVMAYGRTRKGEPQTFPQGIHIPYWSSKREVALEIVSYSSWLEAKVDTSMATTRRFAELLIALQRSDWEMVQAIADDAKAADAELHAFVEGSS